MNYEHAISIRTRQLHGHIVAPLLLVEAIETIKRHVLAEIAASKARKPKEPA